MTKRWSVAALGLLAALGGAVLAPAPASAGPGGQTCVSSRLTYMDGGVEKPAVWWNATVWGMGPAGLIGLASTHTDFNGRFVACVDDAAAPDSPTGGQDLLVVYWAQNAWWKLMTNDPGDPFAPEFVLGVDNGVTKVVASGTAGSPGQPVPLPATKVDQPAHSDSPELLDQHSVWGGFKAFATAFQTFAWVQTFNQERGSTTNCWSFWQPAGTPCHQFKLRWFRGPWDYTFTSYYWPDPDLAKRQVSLSPIHAGDPDVVAHELGHALMHDIYDAYPPIDGNCLVHYLGREVPGPEEAATACAWSEGFADWVSLMVRRSQELDYTSLEYPPESWPAGDRVEGRVAGALLDLADTNVDGCDRYTDHPSDPWNPGDTWTMIGLGKPMNWQQYVNARRFFGLAVPLGPLQQNMLVTPTSPCAP